MSLLQSQSTIAPTVEYRIVEGKPNYRVGNDGSVWSFVTGEWVQLKPTPSSQFGHLSVDLGRGDRRLVHRLVLEAFVGPCPPGLEGCHDPDPDPTNNRIENLRWGTSKENAQDRVRQGRSGRGEQSAVAKLTEAQVREILAMRAAGQRLAEIARWFEIPKVTIEAILYGRSWNHVTGLPPRAPKKPGTRRQLTASEVRTIFELKRQNVMQKDIASRLGVCELTITSILKGRTWRPLVERIRQEMATTDETTPPVAANRPAVQGELWE